MAKIRGKTGDIPLLMHVNKSQISKSTSRVDVDKVYHALHTSTGYHSNWPSFLASNISVSKVSPIFCRYVGNFIFKELIQVHHPITKSPKSNSSQPLTYKEIYALRYAAGYIPQALRKKLSKSRHPLKDDIQLCRFNFVR